MTPYLRTPEPLSRRHLLQHAGLAAAALGGLAACGGGGSTPSAPSSAAGGGGPQTAKAADIPVGSGKIFADSQTVITQPVKGEFKAFSSVCTHARCPVAAVTDTINCACHGSKFSLTDGSVLNPPAQTPLPAKKVTVDGDTINVAG